MSSSSNKAVRRAGSRKTPKFKVLEFIVDPTTPSNIPTQHDSRRGGLFMGEQTTSPAQQLRQARVAHSFQASKR